MRSRSLARSTSCTSDKHEAAHPLFDPAHGLVVGARRIALVEKLLLARMDRLPVAPNDNMRARFARWLGRRFNRPALMDPAVACVSGPIVSRIWQLCQANDQSVDVLAEVAGIRMTQPKGEPPYDLRLLFITSDTQTPAAVRLALARLVVDMRSWLSENARLVAWNVASIYEVSAGDYLNTVPLYAEHLAYQGATVEGTEPPRFGYEDFS